MKQCYIKLVCYLSLLVLMFPSCQIDEIERNENTVQWLMIPDTVPNSHLSKAAVGKKFSEVYFLNFDDEIGYHVYKTIKVRNVKGTICQEWFYEDLHENLFDYVYKQDDVDGLIYGYYYPWEGNLNDVPQSDWNELIMNADGDSEQGFHIPGYSDIRKLKEIYGDNMIRARTDLNVQWDDSDGTTNYTHIMDGAGFWLNPVDSWWIQFPNSTDPNKVDGCGVTWSWVNPTAYEKNPDYYGNGYGLGYSNVKQNRCNVRLVRNITKDQW